MKPKWLRVERAMSFFISVSKTLFKPAYRDVKMQRYVKRDMSSGEE